MSLGFPIETIQETLALTSTHVPNSQVLTDVIYCEGSVNLSSIHHQALLSTTKIDPLLKQLGIHSELPLKKDMIQNLAIMDNVLTYADPEKGLVCKANMEAHGENN